MPNEIYHRSNFGNPNAEGFGDVYYDHAATNKLYNHSDYYENSDGTDATLKDLNNKASIVLTPTAYSDGSLNTVIPPYGFGSELIVNGDFASGTSPFEAYQCTLSNVNNTLVATATSANDSRVKQVMTTVTGKKYKITADLLSLSGSKVGVTDRNFGSFSYSGDNDERTTSGQFVLFFTAQSTTTSVVFKMFDASIGESFSIDNVSVKEIEEADFDFSRGSSATRVNEQGLVQDVQILSGELVQNGDFEQIGSELVTNGDFDTDSDWTKDSGWSIENGQAVCNGVGINSLQQSGITTTGKIYKLSFDVLDSNNFNFLVISTNFADTYVDADLNNAVVLGTNTFYIKPTNGTGIRFRVANGATLSIDNVSVKEVGQNWTFQNGWNMGDGVAVYSGTVSAYRTIYQEDALTVSSKYRLTFDIVSISSGSIENISQSSPTSYSTIGTKTEDFIATSTDLFLKPTTDADLTIDNVSIKEVTDDTDLPRIDFTDGTGSLLLEPQRTNLLTYSEDFSQWASSGVTITSNSEISPDGTQNASLFSHSGGSFPQIALSGITFVSSANYFPSLYVKSDGTTQVQHSLIVNGQVINFTPTNEWVRVSDLIVSPDTSGSFVIAQNSGSAVAASFYIWGGQLEQGDYATSYIPTSGSTVTRSADVANNSGNADLFNDSEGVLYAEVSALSNTPDNSKYISISDGTYNNRASILFSNGATNQIRTFLRVGGVAQIDVSDNVTDVTDFNKVAFSYKENDFKVYINGSLVSTDTSGSVWTSGTINKLSFSEISTSAGLFNGNVKCVAVFKEALSNDLLERLTGEGYESFRLLAEANNYTII